MGMSRLILGSMLFLATLAAGAAAPSNDTQPKSTTFSTDLTGLWYNPLENGWGVNIIQQSQTLFVTMFVYDANNKPTWFFGSDVAFTTVDAQGGFNFTGTLYQATGTYYGANYNPAQFGLTQVGTVNLRFASYNTGTMTYTANGVTVVKNIIPQTWTTNSMTGHYVGTMVGASNCTLPLPQPAGVLNVNVTQTGLAMSMQITDSTGAQCSLTGNVTQYGKLVDVDGSYTCPGKTGTFFLRRMEFGVDGFSGIFASFSSGCSTSGATFAGAAAP
jgi:hypothetical protein